MIPVFAVVPRFPTREGKIGDLVMAVSVILQKFRSLPEKIGLKRLIGEDDFPPSKLFCERCSVLEGDLITGEVIGM